MDVNSLWLAIEVKHLNKKFRFPRYHYMLCNHTVAIIQVGIIHPIIQVGITKIAEAQGIVDRLKFEANEQKVLLDERQAKGRLVLDQISETMTRANSSKNDMEKLKSDAVNKNSALAAR